MCARYRDGKKLATRRPATVGPLRRLWPQVLRFLPIPRMSARRIAVSALFVAVAAALFIVGDEWDSAPGGLFVPFLAVHLVYGAILGTFWAVPVAALVPLAIAPTPWDGYDTELWVQAAFAEAFYGMPFVFVGGISAYRAGRRWPRRGRARSHPYQANSSGPSRRRWYPR